VVVTRMVARPIGNDANTIQAKPDRKAIRISAGLSQHVQPAWSNERKDACIFSGMCICNIAEDLDRLLYIATKYQHAVR
jgi:hypothetical protein